MVKRQLSEQEKKFTLKNIGSLEKRNSHLEVYKELHKMRATDEYKKERYAVAKTDILQKICDLSRDEKEREEELNYIHDYVLVIEYDVQQDKEKQALKDMEDELKLNKNTIETALKQVRVGVDVQKQTEVKDND